MLVRFDRAVHGPPLRLLQQEAFGIADPSATDRWWDIGGHENLRVWVEDEVVLGGLLLIPMGAFIGGTSVPLAGMAGVVVSPAARGRGVARRMLEAALDALEQPLCALYGSTRALYRRCGFGIGGHNYRARVPLDAFHGLRSEAQGWRPVHDDDWPVLQQHYRAWNRHRSLAMDRGPYLWSRIRRPRQGPTHAWCLASGSEITGWIVYRLEPTESDFHRLVVVDLQAANGAALQACATFLQGHAAMCRELDLAVQADSALLDLLPEFRGELRLHEPCLLYVADPAAALTTRGWSPLLTGSVALEIDGSALLLRVDAGRATVTPCELGARLDRAAFASLYTGHCSASELAVRGRLQADAAQRQILDTLFAGPTPDVLDFF